MASLRSSFRFFCLITVIGAIGVAPLGAQQQLSGRVLDPHGQPVAGATVVAIGPSSVPVTTRTDGEGRYAIAASPDGRYDLFVSAPGLAGDMRGVTLESPGTSLDITLRLSAIAEAVVVSTSQVDQPLSRTADSVTVINAAELDARQISTLGAALSTVPGLTVVRSGGPGTLTSLFTRGGESEFTLVLVDGVRANAFGGGIDLSQVPLADVDRIEVARGPQSAIFGADAIGGVIQVVTRQGGDPRLAAQFEIGSRDSRRALVSTTGGMHSFRWQAGGDYLADDGFTGTAPANGEIVTNDDARQRQAWVGGGWRGEAGTDLQGSLRYVDTERGSPGPFGSDPAGRFFGVDTISRGNTERRSQSVRLIHPWGGPSSRVRQRVEFDNADYDLSFLSSFGPSSSETARTHLRVQTDAALDGHVGLSGGLEWVSESARSSFITAGGAEVPVDRQVLGTFGELRWQANERVSVQAGLRAEHITREAFLVNGFADDSVVSVNPKVSASWLVSPALPGATSWTRIRGAVGTGIRPPDLFEIAFTDNPGLKPERSRSVELGVTQALLTGAFQLDATTFFNRYDDLIVSAGSLRDPIRYQSDNVSNARARGLELGAAWQHRRGLHVRAAYTFLDTEILAVDQSAQAPTPYEVGDALLRRPRHSGSVIVGWTEGRITLFTTVETRGETLDAEPAFGPSGGLYVNPGHTVVDLGGGVRLMRGVEVVARVLNLFDRSYEEALGYPAPGRTAFVGVRLATGR